MVLFVIFDNTGPNMRNTCPAADSEHCRSAYDAKPGCAHGAQHIINMDPSAWAQRTPVKQCSTPAGWRLVW